MVQCFPVDGVHTLRLNLIIFHVSAKVKGSVAFIQIALFYRLYILTRTHLTLCCISVYVRFVHTHKIMVAYHSHKKQSRLAFRCIDG